MRGIVSPDYYRLLTYWICKDYIPYPFLYLYPIPEDDYDWKVEPNDTIQTWPNA